MHYANVERRPFDLKARTQFRGEDVVISQHDYRAGSRPTDWRETTARNLAQIRAGGFLKTTGFKSAGSLQ